MTSSPLPSHIGTVHPIPDPGQRNEMPTQPLPCCHMTDGRHLADLPHVYQFDFDLYQCTRCSRFWVFAWREDRAGWEETTHQDAERMQALRGSDLRKFMKVWATPFN